MPTYDYQCRSCGTVTEVIHAMTEDGPTVCEQCGGELRRVLYPAGIIFKGSGFYRTDSRSSGSTSVSSSKSNDGATGTTEAKPAGETKGSAGSSGKGDAGSGSSKASSGGESAS